MLSDWSTKMLDAVLLSLNGDCSDIVRSPPSKYGGIIQSMEASYRYK